MNYALDTVIQYLNICEIFNQPYLRKNALSWESLDTVFFVTFWFVFSASPTSISLEWSVICIQCLILIAET